MWVYGCMLYALQINNKEMEFKEYKDVEGKIKELSHVTPVLVHVDGEQA